MLRSASAAAALKPRTSHAALACVLTDEAYEVYIRTFGVEL